MMGKVEGGLPTQAETLAKLFTQDGDPVMTVSSQSGRFVRLLDILWTLWNKRRQIDIQILQVFGFRSFVMEDLASLMGKLLRMPVVMVLRGGLLPDFARKHPHWVKRVLDRATILVSPSTFLARELAWLGYSIQIIPNVLDLSVYPFRHRKQVRPSLFWLRTFYWTYRPEMAVHVLNLLYKDFPDARLTLAGSDKGLRLETERLVRNLNLTDRVAFPGFLNMEAKIHFAQDHDIYLNTNIKDNMPVSLLEAAAMGLPIVATNGGGIPDLITNEVNGLLVPNDDVQAMVEAVKRLVNNPELASQLSINGRRLAESCSWEQVRPLWERLLAEITL
jgi:glycosyltransferase involved in cell wall biosynthesis